MENANPSSAVPAPDNAKIRKILRVALILTVATLIEFAFAFTLSAGSLKTTIFVFLTLVKAFYIVGEFMHLAHEKKVLIWSLAIPMLILLMLIYILLYESSVLYSYW